MNAFGKRERIHKSYTFGKYNGLYNSFDPLTKSDSDSPSQLNENENATELDDSEQWQTVTSRRSKRRTTQINTASAPQPTLLVNEKACIDIHQLHRIILAVLNHETLDGNWANYSQGSSETPQEARILFVVVPYISVGFLLSHCNSVLCPFLEQRKNLIRQAKSIYIRSAVNCCSILDGVLLEKVDKVKQLVPSDLLSFQESSWKNLTPCRLESLLVPQDEMELYNYPTRYRDWFETTMGDSLGHLRVFPERYICLSRFSSHILDLLSQDPDIFNLLGIDCEMCETDHGKEVIRISVVQLVPNTSKHFSKVTEEEELHEGGSKPPTLKLRVLLDTLVKPQYTVLDYLSQYSGVTQQDLKDVHVTLHQVQQVLKNFITNKTILVGHSLENDLNCLKIFHPRIIDTSLIYHHHHPPLRHSLKYLAYTFLGGLSIQHKGIQGDIGHDSVEDAAVAVELVLLRSLVPRVESQTIHFKPFLTLNFHGSVHVYDALQHDLRSHPLLTHFYKLHLPKIEGTKDHHVVNHCIEELKKEERKDKFHICFLRDFQRAFHDMIGGLPRNYSVKHIYNTTERISLFISMCLNPKTSVPLWQPVPTQLTSPNTFQESENSHDWLSCFKEPQPVKLNLDPKDSVNNSPKEGVNEKDPLGRIWCENLLKSLPIDDPSSLFPSLKQKTIETLLTDLDHHLNLLFDTLKEGDVMIVYSASGNPIPYMGLSRLLRDFGDTEKHPGVQLSSYINYNEKFFDQRQQAYLEFKSPFTCIIKK